MKRDFLISGEDTSHIISIIKPGDIILRNFKNIQRFFIIREYLDSCVYTGKTIVVRNNMNKIIYDNLISYLRCDTVCILRLDSDKVENYSHVKEKAIDRCHQFVEISSQYDIQTEENCHINFEVPIMAYKELGFFTNFSIKKFRYIYDDFSILNSLLFKVIYKKD